MTKGYAKIFSTILASSIWGEDDRTRLVWITMLVLSDRDGQVFGSVVGLAHFARVPPEDCLKALEKFKLPELGVSSTKANDGRRIEDIDGGWRILNHAKYQAMMSLEERQAYWRRKKQEAREREKEVHAGLTSKQIIRREREAKNKAGIQ